RHRGGGYAEDAEGHARRTATIDHTIDRGDDLRIVDLAHLAEARGEVVWTEQHRVDAVDADDRVDVRDGALVLDLHDERDPLVRRRDVIREPEAVAVRSREPDASRAARRIARMTHDLARLLCALHLRDDHARGAEIERLLDRHLDRKSTRLNSSHVKISYAVFCLK